MALLSQHRRQMLVDLQQLLRSLLKLLEWLLPLLPLPCLLAPLLDRFRASLVLNPIAAMKVNLCSAFRGVPTKFSDGFSRESRPHGYRAS